MGLYHKLTNEFSRLAITGAGDRNCLYMTSHIQCEMMNFTGGPLSWIVKFQELASALWDMCGKDNLIINMGGDLNQLVTSTVQCVEMPEPTTNQPTTTMIPISTPSPTQGFTTLKNGRCSTKQYNRVTYIFDARSYELSNPGKARTYFKQLSNQVSVLSRKWKSAGCTAEAYQIPCEMLEFPTNVHGCVLVDIFTNLFKRIERHCGEEWRNTYRPRMDSLLEAGRPISGHCPTTVLNPSDVQRLDDKFRMEFGSTPHEMLVKATKKKKPKSQRNLQELSQKRVDISVKKDKLSVERHQRKVERIRRQKIKAMVLEQLELELNKPVIDMSKVLLDDVVFEEQPEHSESLEYEEEPECSYQSLSVQPNQWHVNALHKFDNQLKQAARESSGSFSSKFALKIRTRYDSLLKTRFSINSSNPFFEHFEHCSNTFWILKVKE